MIGLDSVVSSLGGLCCFKILLFKMGGCAGIKPFGGLALGDKQEDYTNLLD